MKNANQQMRAIRSAFEVLHTNANRSCGILQQRSEDELNIIEGHTHTQEKAAAVTDDDDGLAGALCWYLI
jgi:hypothetical protein